MGIEQFERKIAVLVDSLFAKGSPRGVEPAELGRRLTREIERSTRIGVRSQISPNVIVVALSPEDAEELAPLRRRVEEELYALAEETVTRNGYEVLGPLSVSLTEDPELKSGTFYIDCQFQEQEGFRADFVVTTRDGRRFPLPKGTTSIGRLAGSTITLEDPRVSRKHAEIVVEEGKAVIYDVGSTNGTLVNGIKVGRPVELAPGDVITVGTTDLIFDRG